MNSNVDGDMNSDVGDDDIWDEVGMFPQATEEEEEKLPDHVNGSPTSSDHLHCNTVEIPPKLKRGSSPACRRSYAAPTPPSATRPRTSAARAETQVRDDAGGGGDRELRSSDGLGRELQPQPTPINHINSEMDSRACISTKSNETDNQKKRKKNSTSSEESKACSFEMREIIIGNWRRPSTRVGELTAKVYYKRRRLIWEFLNGKLKSKMEMLWSDITAIKAVMPQNKPGILQIQLEKPPSFHEETKFQPKTSTKWHQTHDFTGGQASLHRVHVAIFLSGVLDKHYKTLISYSKHLFDLSQKPFPNPHSYFDSVNVQLNGPIAQQYSSQFNFNGPMAQQYPAQFNFNGPMAQQYNYPLSPVNGAGAGNQFVETGNRNAGRGGSRQLIRETVRVTMLLPRANPSLGNAEPMFPSRANSSLGNAESMFPSRANSSLGNAESMFPSRTNPSLGNAESIFPSRANPSLGNAESIFPSRANPSLSNAESTFPPRVNPSPRNIEIALLPRANRSLRNTEIALLPRANRSLCNTEIALLPRANRSLRNTEIALLPRANRSLRNIEITLLPRANPPPACNNNRQVFPVFNNLVPPNNNIRNREMQVGFPEEEINRFPQVQQSGPSLSINPDNNTNHYQMSDEVNQTKMLPNHGPSVQPDPSPSSLRMGLVEDDEDLKSIFSQFLTRKSSDRGRD